MLYARIYRKATRRPLCFYGQYALIQEDYLSLFQHAFQKRGLEIAVLSRVDASEESKKKKKARNHQDDSINSRVSLKELPSWLGRQQWNGGVGVFVVSNSSNSADEVEEATRAVKQHMEFRSSGAIITMMCDDEKETRENEKEIKSEIMFLNVPFNLQSSPGVAEASINALGYSRRLARYQVWKQQFKDSFQMLFGFTTRKTSHA
jgi:hypothetical protein